MSARPGFYISRQVHADPGESPNAYAPRITVEIRAFWPRLEKHRVAEILTEAYWEAMAALEEDDG